MYSRAKDSDTLIKYYHVTEFRGLPEARNFGVQHTQYAYILFLDDDIECDCNLQRTADKLFSHKNTVKYRLQRVEQLTGKSFANRFQSQELYNALMIYYFLD